MRILISLLTVLLPMVLVAQVEEIEPNDFGQSGIITISFDTDHIGVSYAVNSPDDPPLPYERDTWYIPPYTSGSRTVTYSGTNTLWFEMYTSNSDYDPFSGSKVIEGDSNDTTITFDFDENTYYYIEVVGPPDSTNFYSFSVSSEIPPPHISSDAPLYIGSTNEVPDSSAILELESTTKGFLPPRMTKEEILAINDPADGLMVYSTTHNLPLYFNYVWKDFSGYPTLPEMGDYAYGGQIIFVSYEGLIAVLDTFYINNPDTVMWGCEGIDILPIEQNFVSNALGATFTQIIYDSCGTSAIAADIALNHVVTSEGIAYDDWHLPTNSEYTYEMGFYLPQIEFWLAQQEDESIALTWNISNGYYSTSSKTSPKRLVLVRTFMYGEE